MPEPRQPQDRKPAAKKTAASRARDASKAALARTAESKATSGVTSEEFAAEATPVVVERPEGCPDFRPLVALPRRARAEYMRAVDVLVTKSRSNPDVVAMSGDTPEEAEQRVLASPSMLRIQADLAEMAADVEDVLRIVAVDAVAFDAWAGRATDDSVMQAFSWFQNSQGDAGNASASPA